MAATKKKKPNVTHRMSDYAEEHCRNILVIATDEDIPGVIYKAVSDYQYKINWQDGPKIGEEAISQIILKKIGKKEFDELLAKRKQIEEEKRAAELQTNDDDGEALESLQGENDDLQTENEELQKKIDALEAGKKKATEAK